MISETWGIMDPEVVLLVECRTHEYCARLYIVSHDEVISTKEGVSGMAFTGASGSHQNPVGCLGESFVRHIFIIGTLIFFPVKLSKEYLE